MARDLSLPYLAHSWGKTSWICTFHSHLHLYPWLSLGKSDVGGSQILFCSLFGSWLLSCGSSAIMTRMKLLTTWKIVIKVSKESHLPQFWNWTDFFSRQTANQRSSHIPKPSELCKGVIFNSLRYLIFLYTLLYIYIYTNQLYLIQSMKLAYFIFQADC